MNPESLIERLEQCNGADRELDARIWAELDGRDVVCSATWHGALFGRNRKPPHDECFIWQPGRAWELVPWFTSSIDAALTLVPVGMEWQVHSGCGAQVNDVSIRPVRKNYADGATPALALCIAALKARMVG